MLICPKCADHNKRLEKDGKPHIEPMYWCGELETDSRSSVPYIGRRRIPNPSYWNPSQGTPIWDGGCWHVQDHFYDEDDYE